MADAIQSGRPDTGGWTPPEYIDIAPIFVWPPKPVALVKWTFGWNGYFFPYNVLYMLCAFLFLYLLPDMEQMKTLQLYWIIKLFVANLTLVIVWISIWHLRLYIQKAQDTEYKYNRRWPRDTGAFLFGSQFYDNAFLTVASAVPIWTAYLVISLWAMANGWVPYLDAREHPVYFVLFVFLLQLFREVHFYAIHRLIHWAPLYRMVHSVHHKNANPTPWSGLAMHPVEHLLYFSGVLLHWVVPSNPFLVVYHLVHAAMGPAPDHSGFSKVVIDGKARVDAATYLHYLHHRYFEVNYGDGAVPLDRWFGTWHDGSEAAHKTMNERFKRKNSSPA